MENNKSKMGLWQAVSMAVGTMIGASIFSVFGVGAQIAKQNLPEAFLLSGVYALIVAYSYAKLGKKITSNAGPIAFILKGIGDNLITGTLSVLMWFTYVISIALFARGFAGYFAPLVGLEQTGFISSIIAIAVVTIFTVLNFFGSKVVGKAEFFIVLIKVGILVLFIAFGLLAINPKQIAPSFEPGSMNGLLHASVIFFLSYMGFGLITNASENIKDSAKNVPRAIYISILIAMIIYVGVAITAIGNLSIPHLIEVKENALAVAAKPFFGNFGFLLISIGALFSISSALNATIYGGANISYTLAKDRELPEFFDRKIWFGSVEGLYITAGLSVVFAILFNMNGIASITSTIFTIIYIFVLISHYKIADEIGGSKSLILFNTCILFIIFGGLLYFQWQSNKAILFGTLGVIVGALLLEFIYRKVSTRSFSIKDSSEQNNQSIS